MTILKPIYFASVLVLALLSTATAQDGASTVTQKSSLTITANATGDRVRVTAPSSIVQMHVEVYAASGEKLFDQEIRGGNVFDWHLQDGQAQRLAPGAYVCVVTAKSVSGRITQKLGTVTVAEKSASVQSSSPQLSLQQTQVIGPVEADSSWTIAAENEPQTPTVIASDGTDGQMIRGRGALTFRVGNFFSGVDQEQMRLTETGNLGIGTSQPQSKLEVAGTIRAERFLVVKPNLGNGDKTRPLLRPRTPVDSVQPLVAGTGTQNQIAKWTDNAGTLGDSVITESPTGKVGVGIASPLSKFHVSSSFDALRLTSTNDTTPVWAQFNTSLGSGLGYFGVEGNTPGTFLAGTLPYATALSSGGSGTALQLGSAGSVKMTILSGGNVGMGTTNPVKRLDVAGDINTSNDYNIGGSRVLSVAGTNNLFAGVNAGQANAGGQNTFVGRGAGFSNIGGNNNSFFGYQAGNNNGNGSQNSFFGVQAGFQSTTGDYSSLFGYQAGFNNRGNFNSFFGGAAGTNNLAGSTNSFFGYDAGFFNTTGNSNAFFGDSSGHSNLGGNYNSFFGDVAGLSNTSGDFNTIIGAGADVSSGSLTHATAIGAQSVISTSNSIGLGRSDGSDTVYVWGLLRTGLDGTGSLDVCRNADLRLSTCSSSLRYKTGIQPFTRGLDVVRRLRPITFNWKDGGMSDIGFGAEDVEQVEPLLTTRNDQGEIEGVKYKQITTVLVNAIKEQQDQIAALQTRLRRLEQALKNRPETKRRHR